MDAEIKVGRSEPLRNPTSCALEIKILDAPQTGPREGHEASGWPQKNNLLLVKAEVNLRGVNIVLFWEAA